MARKALLKAGLPFDLVTARAQIRESLEDRPFVFVPGGWASNKLDSLGEGGVSVLLDFVNSGGNYFGICGGAGLATKEGIGLVRINRKPTSKRVPSFSGKIEIRVERHPIWEGIKRPFCFYVWYPSQLMAEDGVIARFLRPSTSSFSSDLCVGDYGGQGSIQWEDLEREYGINLDPKGLMGEPAVIEGSHGKGRVLISLLHWDTPFDTKGLLVLKNVWRYLGAPQGQNKSISPKKGKRPIKEVQRLFRATKELIELGKRNFLWYWRNPFLLSWRRGVRGLEYSTLFVLIKELSEELEEEHLDTFGRLRFQELEAQISEFVLKSKKLLLRERILMNKALISWEITPDENVNALREELFGTLRRHGGLFKKISKGLEELLYISYCSSS